MSQLGLSGALQPSAGHIGKSGLVLPLLRPEIVAPAVGHARIGQVRHPHMSRNQNPLKWSEAEIRTHGCFRVWASFQEASSFRVPCAMFSDSNQVNQQGRLGGRTTNARGPTFAHVCLGQVLRWTKSCPPKKQWCPMVSK